MEAFKPMSSQLSDFAKMHNLRGLRIGMVLEAHLPGSLSLVFHCLLSPAFGYG